MNGDFADWVTTAEAAELTGYAAVHLRQLAQRGKIRAMKKGRDCVMVKNSYPSIKRVMKWKCR
jgi:excisionase family DNA binding protein